MEICPIAHIRSDFSEKFGIPRQSGLVEELRAGKGTRYAPHVVELLDDPVFYEDTKRFLAESRRQVYVEVYCDAPCS